MIRYNAKILYNNKQNYNSSTDFIVVMSDRANSRILVLIDSNVNVKDLGLGVDYEEVASSVSVSEHGNAVDSMSYKSVTHYNRAKTYNASVYNSSTDFIIVISDSAGSFDMILVDSDVSVSDLGIGKDGTALSSEIFLSDVGVGGDSVSHKSVANYNSRKTYNKKWDAGGASYNSYKHHIVMVEDFGTGADALDILFHDIMLKDNAIAEDVTYVSPLELSLNDVGLTKDSMSLISNVYTTDFGTGADALDMLLEFPASEYFIITANNILEPLGVKVTGDSRHELLPSTRDNSEEVPGRHGEIDFGTEFKARMMELSVVTNNGYTPLEKPQLQRLFAMYLNPIKGPKKLVFGDDVEKTYIVKYSGKIDPTNHPTWFQFVLPFKMSDPFIHGTLEKNLVGSGILVNDGTFETGLIVEIVGPATNPYLTIGGQIISYTGTIPSGKKLVIDTDKETVKIGSDNAMANYNGVFPLLYPGEVNVVSSSNSTIRWRSKWI